MNVISSHTFIGRSLHPKINNSNHNNKNNKYWLNTHIHVFYSFDESLSCWLLVHIGNKVNIIKEKERTIKTKVKTNIKKKI